MNLYIFLKNNHKLNLVKFPFIEDIRFSKIIKYEEESKRISQLIKRHLNEILLFYKKFDKQDVVFSFEIIDGYFEGKPLLFLETKLNQLISIFHSYKTNIEDLKSKPAFNETKYKFIKFVYFLVKKENLKFFNKHSKNIIDVSTIESYKIVDGGEVFRMVVNKNDDGLLLDILKEKFDVMKVDEFYGQIPNYTFELKSLIKELQVLYLHSKFYEGYIEAVHTYGLPVDYFYLVSKDLKKKYKTDDVILINFE
ncbi:hypothetical protein A0H76_2156 [Hepatospora eriocheir]|uniref:Uncharacterized protein n=1 Tax=Hepatospora eriocheir TaxID=1081669 RepID=A0A1X0QK38_9MICR|nr:hypothetical protein A0H76_2156 [Hepatospora eriocheir]